MARRAVTVLSVVIVVATPAVFVGNTVALLMQPWFVDAQYRLPVVGEEQAIEDPQRTALAKAGVRAIRPGGDGVALLERARLPDGGPAFEADELRHMRDVRGLVGSLGVVWLVALTSTVAAALALRRLQGAEAVRAALWRGGRLTIAIMGTLGVAMLVGFDQIFTAFHAVTFEGRSWRFGDDDTLRQLYPDAFWVVGGGALTGLVLAQAAAAVAFARPSGPSTPAR